MEFGDPLDIECCGCQAIRRLFDINQDGYNAEIGDLWDRDTNDPKHVWTCPQCQSPEGRLIASFGYQYELFEPHEPESHRSQDYFDAFLLHHFCVNDDSRVEVIVFECA